MNPKVIKIGYWVSTILMCAVFLFSATMYFTKYEMVSGFFEMLGFPVWLIYPLAVAKVLGVVAVIYRKIPLLKEWAYAGFFFDAVLALVAHLQIQDGGHTTAILALVFIVASRFFEGRLSS